MALPRRVVPVSHEQAGKHAGRGDEGFAPISRRSFAQTFFGWRTHFGFGWVEAAVLAVYCAVLAVTIPFHEPWSDEAQAWLIARDNSLWQIYRYRMHYEGAPALWQTLLHVLTRLHAPYSAMPWFGGCCAVAGIVVLLRWSPFPLLIRISLPFTFWLQYQYAVVARGYVLFPLLVFLLCILFRSRRNPVWFGLIAGLLANISLQGVIFSAVLLLLYLKGRLPVRRFNVERHPETLRWAPLLRCAGIYGVLLGICIWVALPAPDQGFANGEPVIKQTSRLHALLVRFPGERPPDKLSEKEGALVQRPVILLPRPKLFAWPGDWAGWYLRRQDVLYPGTRRPLRAVVKLVFGGAAEATWPVSTSKLLGCVFLLTLAWWLRAHRFLRGLIPWGLLIFVGERLWVADHHAGLLFVALLAAIWLGYENPTPAGPRPALDHALVLLFALICALQVTWSVVSIRADIQGNYDPGRETARFLKNHRAGRMVGFDFFTTSMEPYYARTPFADRQTAYWVWSLRGNPDMHYLQTIATHPDTVVFSFDTLGNGAMHNEWAPLFQLLTPQEQRDLSGNAIVNDLHEHGYRETHRFCGFRFTRYSASYESCDVIFEPAPGT